MSSVQNLDACYYFAEEVLPLLRNYYDCKFRVMGANSSSEEDKLSKIDGVEVKSNVEDISAAVGNARIGVAPIRIGAGIKTKF